MTDDAHGYGPRHREARRRGLDTCPACRRAGITEPPTYSDEFIVARVRALVTEHPDTQVPIVALDDLRRALGDQ